jgi:hypothetical protein
VVNQYRHAAVNLGAGWSERYNWTELQQAKVTYKYAICTAPFTVVLARFEQASAFDWLAQNAFAPHALLPAFFQRLNHTLVRQLY